MPKSPVSLIKRLPTIDEHWLVVVHRLRMWVTPPNEAPSRPYGLFIFVLENGYLVGNDLTPLVPTADQVQAALFKAMRKPPAVSGPPRRPAGIALVDENLAQALQRVLDEVDVRLAIMPEYPPEMDDILREMEAAMSGGPEPPGLLSVKGATPDFVAHLFAAAAEFYRSQPWVALSNEQIPGGTRAAGTPAALRLPAGQWRRGVRPGSLQQMGGYGAALRELGRSHGSAAG